MKTFKLGNRAFFALLTIGLVLFSTAKLAEASSPSGLHDWEYFENWGAMPLGQGSRALAPSNEDGIMVSVDFAPELGCGATLVIHFSDARVSDLGYLSQIDLLIQYRVDRNDIWEAPHPTLATGESMDGRGVVDSLSVPITDDFVDEIRRGQILRVKIEEMSAFRIDLSGSLAAIERAVSMCSATREEQRGDDDYFPGPGESMTDDDFF
ncbi:hypothetical protein [Thioalkalivibrio sp. ALE20]|uniref:hypothetical protein n=1 Tax=Thioalkalivibrio sp. ALE20 TaxID=545275 RepID=UPI0012E9C962|nr:hypothetical protein [Thioalkalivibrio sp. ALE20]